MLKQIELELQVAYQFAVIGDVDRATFHVDLAKQYLLETANEIKEQNEYIEKQEREQKAASGEMRYWKEMHTLRVIGTDEPPGDGWQEISRAEYKIALNKG